jgi:hypothetical protein
LTPETDSRDLPELQRPHHAEATGLHARQASTLPRGLFIFSKLNIILTIVILVFKT